MSYSDYLKKISGTKKIAGYSDTYVPEEMILACGMHPVRLMSDDSEPAVTSAYIQGFCCPYAKNLLEQAFSGKLSFLSAVVFSRYCDSLRGVYEVWKTEKLSPVVAFIRSAQVVREDAVDYMTREFIAVFEKLAADLGGSLDEKRLAAAISETNRKRKALLGLYAMRKQRRLNVSAESFYGLVFSAGYLGIDDFMEQCLAMSGRAEKLPAEDDRPAVVVSGAEMDNAAFFRLLDETGFFAASDDLAAGTRNVKDLVKEDGTTMSDMVRNVARRYVMKPPCSVKDPADRRIDELVEEVRGSKAAGVIFLRTPFCDSEGVEYAFVERRLKAENIPHLYIETDQRLSNLMQIRNRLEAFREQIGGIL